MKSLVNRLMLGIVVATLVSGCGREPYPEPVRENYLAACEAQGGSQSYCRCTLRKVEDTYSLKEFKRMETRARATGELPSGFTDAAADCS